MIHWRQRENIKAREGGSRKEQCPPLRRWGPGEPFYQAWWVLGERIRHTRQTAKKPRHSSATGESEVGRFQERAKRMDSLESRRTRKKGTPTEENQLSSSGEEKRKKRILPEKGETRLVRKISPPTKNTKAGTTSPSGTNSPAPILLPCLKGTM